MQNGNSKDFNGYHTLEEGGAWKQSSAMGDFDIAALSGGSVTPAEGGSSPRKPVAIIAVHGMGQQVPHSTLAAAAGLIRKQKGSVPQSELIYENDNWHGRTKCVHESGLEVHVYEGYWATLASGKTTALGALKFLLGSGFAAMKHLRSGFKRWTFGEFRTYRLDPTIKMGFILATFTILALSIV